MTVKQTEGTLAPHELYIQKVKDQERRQKRNRTLFLVIGIALAAMVGIGYKMIPSTIEMKEEEVYRSFAAEDLSVYEVNNYFKENKSPIVISYNGATDPDTIHSVDDFVAILNAKAAAKDHPLAEDTSTESDSVILIAEDNPNQAVELLASSTIASQTDDTGKPTTDNPSTTPKANTLGDLIAQYKQSRDQVASKIKTQTPKEQSSSNHDNNDATPSRIVEKPNVSTSKPIKPQVDSLPSTKKETIVNSNPSQNPPPPKRRETEKRPSFVGGSNALQKFILKEINYPRKAIDKGIEGNVFVTFVVGVEGEIIDAKVIKGIGYGCDKEALRVVQRMNRMWEPGHRNRKRLPMSFTLPVPFKLN